MDRQLLLCLVVTALILGGCSGDKSPPPAEAVTYQQKTTYDFPDDQVSGNLLRPNGSDQEESPAATTAAVPEGLESVPGPGFGTYDSGRGGGFSMTPPGSEAISGSAINSSDHYSGGGGGGLSKSGLGAPPQGANENPIPANDAAAPELHSPSAVTSDRAMTEAKRALELAVRRAQAEEARQRANYEAQEMARQRASSRQSSDSFGPASQPSLSAEEHYSSADSDRALKEAQRAVAVAQKRLREEERIWRDLEERRRSKLGGLAGRPAEASGQPSSLNPSAPTAESDRVETEIEIAQRQARAEERRRTLDEIQKRIPGVTGIFGTQPIDGSEQPNPLIEKGANSLRGEASGAGPPDPATANPLRTAQTAPQTPALPPPAAADPPPPQAEPAGGAAPPPRAGWLAEMERAFAANPTPAPGSPASDPPAPRPTGASAPETSPPTTEEPGGSAFRSAAENTAAEALPKSAAPEESPFDVVEVFYGTDRQSADAIPFRLMQLLVGAWPTASMSIITLCVGLFAAGRKSWMLWLVTAVGLAVSLGLGYQTSASALAVVRDAGKEGPRYTTDRAGGGRVELGHCEVTIPKTHESGELEAPSILRLEVAEDAASHVILSKTERLADSRFYELLRDRVAHSVNRELFVFVHGFNVSFADAARRTAQIHHDLKFDGAPIFFSWPAHDKSILTYPADETNVAWSTPHLKQFLLEIVKESQAKSINLIAHSMGNRALATALREIELELHDQAKLFNQVILAAPDIDADDFRNNIAPAMQRTAQRLTLYASSHDEALSASKLVHRFPRAGDAGDGLIVIPGMDTIDVTGIDSSLWGHGYIGSSNRVLRDLRMLLSRAIPAQDRVGLSPADHNGQTYWIFQRTESAAPGSSIDFSASLAAVVPGANDSQLQAEMFRNKADDQKLAALLEDEKLSLLGGLTGGSPARAPEPAPQASSPDKGANPLRVDVAAVPSPITGSGEPRGEPRIPRIPATAEPRFAPAPTPALPTSAGPTAVPPLPPMPSSYEPSGGAAPPAGGLAEIERAFSNFQPPPPSAPTAPTNSEPASAAKVVSVGPAVASAAPPSGPFDVVEVFYGTDRQPGEAPPSDWQHILLCFLPTASVSLMATCLAFAAAGRKSWLLGAIAIFGVVVSLGLGYEGAAKALALVRNAGHQGPRYTIAKAPAGRVEVGRCEVTIPKSHSPGEVETPSLLRLEIAPDAAEHLVLYKTEPLGDAKFYEALRERVEQSSRRELFVFVHGFNVSFEDAARRTAQIHYDLKFQGAPIFFSWPANDRFLFTYPADETNVAWSVPHLKQFLLSIVKESQAKSINLIAHSMGNRALAAALREIELELRDEAKLFNQVILAAPDIDADDFRHNIAPAMQRTAQRLTLYASSRDEALLASQYLHRGARAGAAGDGLIVLPGMDTIDVTPIDRSLWGHAYYGSSNPVLNDLRILLSRAVPPKDRKWLSPAERDGREYWIFQPARTAEAHGELTR